MSAQDGKQGKVYLVGAGPGAPGLITLLGKERLSAADVVVYDYLVNPAILAHAPESCLKICLGRHGRGERLDQPEVNRLLVDHARQGRVVVRLKGGDPVIFGHLVDELTALEQAGIDYEIVPGITAALAAGSYAGIPLTHRELSSAVALVTGQEADDKQGDGLDFAGLAKFPGTLVIYMGVTTVADWSARLLAAGKAAATPVAILRRCSWPDQTVIHATLGDAARIVVERHLRPPVVMIVGEVASERQAFDWRSRLPLLGVSILIARPEGQATDTALLLEQLGAKTLLQPAIEITAPLDWSLVDRAIARLGEFDWVVFSSANGVEYFCNRLWTLGRDARSFGRCKIAAIGPGTERALQSWRLRIDARPSEYRAEQLAEAIAADAAGKNCLLIRASRGRETLSERLMAAGALVEQVVAYQSVDVATPDPAIAADIEAGNVEWALVTSSAIARSLARLFGDRLKRCKLASISPVTSQTLRELGHETNLEATEFTMRGLAAALCQHYGH